MEMLIAWLVLAFLIKRGVVDVAAMATGRTPPSHAYRMAKLKQKQQERQVEADPDTRGGFKRVLAHWYRDACEDVDEWRANRRKTRPERKAAKAERKRRRQGLIDRARQRMRAKIPGVDDEVPVPEVPDNVIPLRARPPESEAAAPDDPPAGAPAGEDPPAPGGQTANPDQGGLLLSETPATDQAGLTPHLAALDSARQRCDRVIANIDRIRAQMEGADVGGQVTAQAGPAVDATRAAEQQLGKAAEVLEQINRQVLEQLDASQHQAGDKDYLEPETAGGPRGR